MPTGRSVWRSMDQTTTRRSAVETFLPCASCCWTRI